MEMSAMNVHQMPERLSHDDQHRLAEFFGVFWASVVLNPRGLQSVRGTMASIGLVEKRGKLALTPSGERAMALLRTKQI
jgi:Mn-dependent DtxR family transcriptional regulator